MKAYKDVKGKLRLFRPDLNMERLNSSLTRLYMPVSGQLMTSSSDRGQAWPDDVDLVSTASAELRRQRAD